MVCRPRLISIPVWLLLAGVAMAADPAAQKPTRPLADTPPSMIRMMDRNGDDQVDEQEFIDASLERIRAAFKQFDLNNDGLLTHNEEREIFERRKQVLQQRYEQQQRGQQPRRSPTATPTPIPQPPIPAGN